MISPKEVRPMPANPSPQPRPPRRLAGHLLTIGLCGALTAGAEALIWDNGSYDPLFQTMWFSQLDTVYPFNAQVADDFTLSDQHTCCGPMHITGISWFGGWVSPGPPGDPTDFNLILYADDGGVPTGAGMDDPTTTALKVITLPRAELNEQPVTDSLNSYTADLSADPFIVDPDTTYWLVIQSVNVFPPKWGWAVTTQIQGNPAARGWPLYFDPFWTVMETDMAFTMDGFEASPCPWDCQAERDCDVGIDDLVALINHWGPCADPGDCPWDCEDEPDGTVDIDDLVAVINHWGPCP
jgi:hypothetical protein